MATLVNLQHAASSQHPAAPQQESERRRASCPGRGWGRPAQSIGHLGAIASVVVFCSLLPVVSATCRLKLEMPSGTAPSGLAIGPSRMLITSCRDGTVLHANPKDGDVEQELVVGSSDADPYHRRDLRGCAMTNPESSYFYLGAASEPSVFEYEWHTARRITRRFMLPGFEHPPTEGGIQSLTWVPTDASRHQGYFYVGSPGCRIFIYDLPLVEDTGPEAIGRLISVWTPLQGSSASAGLSFSGGMLFVSYDQGSSNHVLVFEVLENGLQGALLEQYEVDVPNGCGLAVRREDATTWEAFFCFWF